MREHARDNLVTFREDHPVWERVFTVNPLVVVGTREESGAYDLAPKHLAMPMGWENYFGFVCTPRHNTYYNARREGVFTVSYPRPTQVLLASLAAAPRDTDGSKLAADALPTFPASEVDGVFVEDAYLFLECARPHRERLRQPPRPGDGPGHQHPGRHRARREALRYPGAERPGPGFFPTAPEHAADSPESLTHAARRKTSASRSKPAPCTTPGKKDSKPSSGTWPDPRRLRPGNRLQKADP
jgi:hypothetical protein